MKNGVSIKMQLAVPTLMFALMSGGAVFAQQTTPATAMPDPVSQTTAAPVTSTPMTKEELKAQKKQEKQQEKAANANAKAAKAQAKAKKEQDNALQQQEKAARTPPQS